MPERKAGARRSPEIETLASGMRAVFLPSDANNIVALGCFIPLPAAIEQPEEAGLVSFALRMLLRGTTRMGNEELSEAIESLGTSISFSASDDFSHGSMVCTGDTFDESLRLFADVMQNPAFEPEEVERERQTTLAAIRRSDDEKFSYTMKRFLRELYGPHSYGLPRTGLIETVSEFRREQVAAVHGEFVDPGQCLAVCVGNFDPGAARSQLDGLLQPRPSASAPPGIAPVRAVEPTRSRFSRECEQAFLVAGFQACGVLSPDFAAVRVLNGVLGEGMSSRLFVHLRDEKGLAYATGSTVAALRSGGHLAGYIGTKPGSLDEAREGMLAEFAQIRREPVPAEELERAKNYITGKFLIDHQTNARRAFYLGYYETLGLGMAMDEDYPGLIAAVTAGQVRDAANKYLGEPTIAELVPTAD
jgi:predicted Zn-dependent peptidase